MPPISSGSDVVAAAMIPPVSLWHRPRSVNAERATRSRWTSGNVSVASQSVQYRFARCLRSGSGTRFGARSSVPQRSSSRTGWPFGVTTALAVSCMPSDEISQSTPGEYSAIGSDVPTTSRPFSLRTSLTGT
jgi:hypothetical protein